MATDEEMSARRQQLVESAAKGGHARANRLTREEREEGARKAASARWAPVHGDAPPLPKAEYTGELQIGDLVLDCAVLDDGRRVLSERGLTAALGGKRGGSHWRRVDTSGGVGSDYLPVFMSAGNLQPYIQPSLAHALSQPIVYRARTGGRAYGVLATLIPEICEVWLKARRHEALLSSQEHLAERAEVLLSGLAQVGIVALVDEVTGYQVDRDKHELHRILAAYISKELLPWTKRFPDEFYRELFRLRGWLYSPPSPKRPLFVGKLTKQLVYEQLPPGVLTELERRNPVSSEGRRRHKHHQLLTDEIGNPHLERHLASVITLMRASPSWNKFIRLFQRAFPSAAPQGEFEFPELDEG